ncbi:MAG: hypothetical protein RMY16_26265 [Nostoc sp. DedQUE12b]|uniref:hypothetical protein n=1 Tax=Nostoc sp. DedQUE12b TaxID=3075398 RepID=UPI002AD4E21B|nr:hypothetical protein [Nostoc sp. DedQUE12b]MDZ8089025.1 hypothetical protein [Nostoc sp. DedQUE12b]
MKQIKDLGTELTTPANSDLIPTQQADGTTRHITRENFLQGIGGGNKIAFAQIADIKSQGTNAGVYSTANTTITRDINTVVNSATWLTLNSNIFTLTTGTYIIDALVPGYFISQFRAWIEDSTTAALVLLGTAEYSTVSSVEWSRICGQIIISSEEQSFRVRFRATSSRSETNLLGAAINISGQSEIYTQINIIKVA